MVQTIQTVIWYLSMVLCKSFKKIFVFLLFTFHFSLFTSILALQDYQIKIKTETEVVGPTIKLADIAEFKGLPKAEVEQLSSIKVGVARPPGTETKFSKQRIEALLYNGRVKRDKYNIFIPNEVIVKTKASIVSGKELTNEAIKFLEENLPWEPTQIEIKSRRLPADIILPFGKIEFSPWLKSKNSHIGQPQIFIRVYLDEKLKREIDMSSYIEVFCEIVKAATTLPRGEIIEDIDIKLEKENIASLPRDAFTEIEHVIGKKVITNISEGAVLTPRLLEIPPIVQIGNIVDLIISKAGLEISTPGKVLEKGYTGSIIKVLNIESKKILSGKVINEKTVEILF